MTKATVRKTRRASKKTKKIVERVQTPFATESQDSPLVIGVIHAKWCGFCKSLMNENAGAWPQFVEEMKHRPDVELHSIEDSDSDKEEKLTKLNNRIQSGDKIKVSGFPTVFSIAHGKGTCSGGAPSLEELKALASGMSGGKGKKTKGKKTQRNKEKGLLAWFGLNMGVKN